MNVYFCGLDDLYTKKLEDLLKIYSDNGGEVFFSKITLCDEIMVIEDKVQVYFCMPEGTIDGVNGINFAESVRKINKKAIIIFLSQNMLSVGGILKRYICPAAYFLYDELENLADFVIRTVQQLEQSPDEANIKLEIVSKYEKIEVSLNNVLYFVSCNKKIVCNMANGQKVEFYGTLSSIEKLYDEFLIRCHSGYLVNKQKISEVNYTKNYMRVFDSNEKIPISRKYRPDIKRFLNA